MINKADDSDAIKRRAQEVESCMLAIARMALSITKETHALAESNCNPNLLHQIAIDTTDSPEINPKLSFNNSCDIHDEDSDSYFKYEYKPFTTNELKGFFNSSVTNLSDGGRVDFKCDAHVRPSNALMADDIRSTVSNYCRLSARTSSFAKGRPIGEGSARSSSGLDDIKPILAGHDPDKILSALDQEEIAKAISRKQNFCYRLFKRGR